MEVVGGVDALLVNLSGMSLPAVVLGMNIPVLYITGQRNLLIDVCFPTTVHPAPVYS